MFGPINATFLLAGLSLETSLEFIAHSEARVARLTSSKTAAMSSPLFRLQGRYATKNKAFTVFYDIVSSLFFDLIIN